MEAATIIADSSSSTSAVAPSKPTGTISWWGGPSRKQNFSLPSSIIYYIARNPSSRDVYEKLVQSCKYFFERLPLLLVKTLLHSDGTKICARDIESCAQKNHSCCVDIDLQKIASRIWLSVHLGFTGNGSSDIIPILLSKLYQSEILLITLKNKTILYDDLKYLASPAKYICLDNTMVIYNDGTPVMLDKIIEVCPHLSGFEYNFISGFPVINDTTFKAITKLDNFKTLTTIIFGKIPEACDVDDFCTFVQAHEYEYFLCLFDRFDMSQDYKAKLDAFCDDVIKSEVLHHLILYPGQNEKKMEIMASRMNSV